MKISQMIEADKAINRFMGNRTGADVRYWDSWGNLMKVTKRIFKDHEKQHAGVCEMLRYALYWNNFEHIYEVTIFTINHLKGWKQFKLEP